MTLHKVSSQGFSFSNCTGHVLNSTRLTVFCEVTINLEKYAVIPGSQAIRWFLQQPHSVWDWPTSTIKAIPPDINTKKSLRTCGFYMMAVVSVSRVWLCDPLDCSPPGSSVHEIYQARILEWVVISFSKESSQLRDWTHISHVSWIGRQILYHWATWKTFQMIV